MKHSWGEQLLWITATIFAVVNLVYIVHANRNQFGAGDFYTYWYYGHFVRQSDNPYLAYEERKPVPAPVAYLDGQQYQRIPEPWGHVRRAPTNLAPLLILLSSFSWFAWPVARVMWMVVNFLLALSAPFLLCKIAPLDQLVTSRQKALLVLCFLATSAVRNTGAGGQTSLLILVCMIGSWQTHQRGQMILSGLLLGIALSKYSLALPLLVAFIVMRNWMPIMVALATQWAGLFLLALSSNSSVWATVQIYASIMLRHVDRPGVHVARWMPYGTLLMLLGGVAIVRLMWRKRKVLATYSLNTLHVGGILCLWTLLVAYHERYDAVLLLLVFALLLIRPVQPEWRLNHRLTAGLDWYLLAALWLMMLPITSPFPSLIAHPAWYQLAEGVTSFVILTMLIVLVGLIQRIDGVADS